MYHNHNLTKTQRMYSRDYIIADMGIAEGKRVNCNEPRAFMDAFDAGVKLCRCCVYMDRSNPICTVPRLATYTDGFDEAIGRSGDFGEHSFLLLLLVTAKEYPGAKYMVSFTRGTDQKKTADDFLKLFEDKESIYGKHVHLIDSIVSSNEQLADFIAPRARKLGIKHARMFRYTAKNTRPDGSNPCLDARGMDKVDIFLFEFLMHDLPETIPVATNEAYRSKLRAFIKYAKKKRPDIKFVSFYIPLDYDHEGVWIALKEIGFDYVLSSLEDTYPDIFLPEIEEKKKSCVMRPKKFRRPKKIGKGWKC